MLLWLSVVSVVFALFIYIEALKAGMKPRRWCIAALLIGPVLWPLFAMERLVMTRRELGWDGIYWRP